MSLQCAYSTAPGSRGMYLFFFFFFFFFFVVVVFFLCHVSSYETWLNLSSCHVLLRSLDKSATDCDVSFKMNSKRVTSRRHRYMNHSVADG